MLAVNLLDENMGKFSIGFESGLMAGYPKETSNGMPGAGYVWIVQAPYYYLEQFGRIAGLARDSAKPVVFALEPDWFAEARLTYPGSGCDRPETWIKVLALLHLHHVPFKLYLGTGNKDSFSSLVLLRPAVDRELAAILGTAAIQKVIELGRFGEMLDRTFALIENMGATNFDENS